MNGDVSVILVNYNSGADLARCLEHLARQSRPAEVVIVDNASTDGSHVAAYRRFPSHRYLPFRRNAGFARAVNLAMKRTTSPYVVLLNPDTTPRPSFIESIVAPLEADESFGAVAGTLVFENAPDLVASAGITVHANGVAIDTGLGGKLEERQMSPIFGASGGAACYRRKAFLEVGGFAEPFFMYLEDVDLAWRLRMRGWEAISTPDAVVEHRYSGAAGEGSAFKRRLLARNRIWTLVRCLPDELWRRDGLRIAGYDAGALAYGAIFDRAAAAGRAEAAARILPRLCERRAIQRSRRAPVHELVRWIEEPISLREIRRLRALTGRLAAST